MLAKRMRSPLAIGQAKMDSRYLRLSAMLAVALVGATKSHTTATPTKHGSTTLCGSIGRRVVAADANLAQAAQIAVALGSDDSEVLSGTRARYGSAFKMVEDDQKLVPELFHAGMNEVTAGQIAADSLTIPAEIRFAGNTFDSYSNSLNAVEEFSSFALFYERSVNSKNRRSKMVGMSEAFAALGDYRQTPQQLR